MHVSYAEPGAIVDLMQNARSQTLGVQQGLFLIDDALGDAFAKAGEQGIPNPLEVLGPPCQCKVHTRAENNRHKQENEEKD